MEKIKRERHEMQESKEETKVFNPDMNKEVLIGIAGMLLFMGGIIVSFVGLIATTGSKLLGIIIWLVGTGLIIGSLIISIKNKHGKGFRIANIGIKIFALVISLLLFVIILITGGQ